MRQIEEEDSTFGSSCCLFNFSLSILLDYSRPICRRAHAVIYTVEFTIYTELLIRSTEDVGQQQLTSLDSLLSWLLVIGETLSLHRHSVYSTLHSPSALLLLDLNNGQVEMKIERYPVLWLEKELAI